MGHDGLELDRRSRRVEEIHEASPCVVRFLDDAVAAGAAAAAAPRRSGRCLAGVPWSARCTRPARAFLRAAKSLPRRRRSRSAPTVVPPIISATRRPPPGMTWSHARRPRRPARDGRRVERRGGHAGVTQEQSGEARHDAAERGPLPDGRQRRGALRSSFSTCSVVRMTRGCWCGLLMSCGAGWSCSAAAFVAQSTKHWVRSRIVLVDTWRCFEFSARSDCRSPRCLNAAGQLRGHLELRSEELSARGVALVRSIRVERSAQGSRRQEHRLFATKRSASKKTRLLALWARPRRRPRVGRWRGTRLDGCRVFLTNKIYSAAELASVM